MPLAHVVCEATGGYERPMVEACHKAKILISLLNPAHTLAASQAQGKRAKTDPADAAALTDYGQCFQPKPTASIAPAVREITELTLWLKQLIDNRAVVKTQAEHHTNDFVGQQHVELLAHYQSQIQIVEKKIEKLVQIQTYFQLRVDRLTQIKGVGFRTALLTLVFLPELGPMNRGGAAALAGLAPWTRDSGTMKDKRCIGSGRAQFGQFFGQPSVTFGVIIELELMAIEMDLESCFGDIHSNIDWGGILIDSRDLLVAGRVI